MGRDWAVKDSVVSFTRPVLDFRITLEARNPARRCLRHYRVEAGTDLFGVWVVEISYCRIGTAGRSRRYVLRKKRRPGTWPGASSSAGPARHDGSGSRIASASSSIPQGWVGVSAS